MTVGQRLKKFAKLRGGVSKLAELLNISQPRLSQYISGRNQIDQDILLRIGDLGCDINWLLTGKSTNPYSIVPIEEVEKNHVPQVLSFPILGEIPAGISEIRQYEGFFEYFDFDLDPHKHGILRIDQEFGLYHSDRSKRLMDDNRDMVLACKRFLDEIEKLKNEVKKLKSNT